MSIEEAYSIEYENIIDAEKAYELFWSGQINDKTAFECIFCDAQITCANLDKERNEIVNLPHFKCTKGHNNNCQLILGEINKINKINNNKGKSRSFINEDIDELEIMANILGVQKVNIDNLDDEHRYKSSKKEKIINEYKQGLRRKSKYNSIRPVISKYQKYKKEGILDAKYINVYKDKNDSEKDINISYREMFINIFEQCISKISNYKRIYYGQGTIIKIKNGYMVIFDVGFNKDNNSIKTTFFINEERHLSKLNNFEQWKNRLEGITKNKEKIMIYIYTNKVKEASYDKEGKKVQVINLILDNIGCFDYRKL